MKVFKFGGASVRDADAVRNVAHIVKSFSDDSLVVVVSAMDKTTNALEKLLHAYLNGKDDLQANFTAIKESHLKIARQLFQEGHPTLTEISRLMEGLEERLRQVPGSHYDYEYDQVVSVGEVLSSVIIAGYLNTCGISCQWADARKLVLTDRTFREGKVDWDLTQQQIKKELSPLLAPGSVILTQGFIGHTPENHVTTLGREGSDYSAAIFAWCLDAESVMIWKDVPGMLNADPKWFKETVMLPRISFKEALELSYYGATVIHPKTIKPLQNKNIPLYVKSFLDPAAEGTVIQQDTSADHLVPSYIFKTDQLLVSIFPKDFSFMVEENLRDVFEDFSKMGVKINLMQNSALDFSVVVDKTDKVWGLIEKLKEKFRVLYNEDLRLLTIRHYDQPTLDKVVGDKLLLLEQRTRQTVRVVYRPEK